MFDGVDKVLVVAAHADDEVLGCGGVLSKHHQHGSETHVVIMTNGVGSRDAATENDIVQREKARDKAYEIMGVSGSKQGAFSDNAMDSVPLIDIVHFIESYLEEIGMPDVVYTHHPGDLNVDHQITHRAVLTAFRPQPSELYAPRYICNFEVPSSTGWYGSSMSNIFNPNIFVNVAEYVDVKLQALKAYDIEMRQWPHARSYDAVLAQLKFRGATVGVEAAESFYLERALT